MLNLFLKSFNPFVDIPLTFLLFMSFLFDVTYFSLLSKSFFNEISDINLAC